MVRIQNLIDIFLNPGELFVGDASFQIRTILGSCVSITLWHPLLQVGGMSHFLLPTRGITRRSEGLDGRYGDESLQLMIKDLSLAGVNPALCQAKVFGGANMFPRNRHSQEQQKRSMDVGRRNGHAAKALLRHHGIPIVSGCLFGVGHRQIIFDISKGHVWSSQVVPSSIDVGVKNSTQGK